MKSNNKALCRHHAVPRDSVVNLKTNDFLEHRKLKPAGSRYDMPHPVRHTTSGMVTYVQRRGSIHRETLQAAGDATGDATGDVTGDATGDVTCDVQL